MSPSLEDLPLELLEEIFLYLPLEDYPAFSLLSSTFYSIAKDRRFWQRRFSPLKIFQEGKTVEEWRRVFYRTKNAKEGAGKILGHFETLPPPLLSTGPCVLVLYLYKIERLEEIEVANLDLVSLKSLVVEEKKYKELREEMNYLPRSERDKLEAEVQKLVFRSTRLHLKYNAAKQPFLILTSGEVRTHFPLTLEEALEFLMRLIFYNIIPYSSIERNLSSSRPFFMIT